jgi:ATP-dependent DNA ligase
MHAHLVDGKARLLTRTGLDWSDRYLFTFKALQAVPVKSAYLDDELCTLGPDDASLRPWQSRLVAPKDEIAIAMTRRFSSRADLPSDLRRGTACGWLSNH